MILGDCDKPQPGGLEPGAGHTERMIAADWSWLQMNHAGLRWGGLGLDLQVMAVLDFCILLLSRDH